MDNRIGLFWLIVGGILALQSCSGSSTPPPLAISPQADVRIEPPPAASDEAGPDSNGRNLRFDKELLEVAAEYLSWGRIDDEQRWGPVGCNTFARDLAGRPAFSSSSDENSHGQKLYSVFARDRDAYLRVTAMTSAPVGQAIVKQSWIPEEVETSAGSDATTESFDVNKVVVTRLPDASKGETLTEYSDRFYPYASKDGKVFKAAKQADLFIMMKLDSTTPNTDAGWVYGTVTPDGKKVTSSDRVATCMNCHVDAPGDRLFGMPQYRSGAAVKELLRLGAELALDDDATDLSSFILQVGQSARIDDQTLVLVEYVTELKRLRLDNSHVTDMGLEHVAKMSQLEELGLSRTRVGDDGLAKLAELKKLQKLDLSGTRVTDAGLAHLGSLPNLRTLNLEATEVTEAGIAGLKKALPELQIRN